MSLKLSGLFRPLTLSSALSLLSLTIGVCTLLVSMALVNSYEKSFKESIYSVFSHASVYSYSYNKNLKLKDMTKDLSRVYSKGLTLSEASKKEGLLAHKGKVSGVLLEGVNANTIESVINLRQKVVEGEFGVDGSEVSSNPKVMIGKSISERFKLKINDIFSVVIPHKDHSATLGFSRKVYTFKVGGVLDFGSYDSNKRFIVAEKSHVNKILLKPQEYFSEVKVKLSDPEDVGYFKNNLMSEFPKEYWVKTWKEKSGGLLEAIKIERMVIFFLVLILVVVAAFNVSTNLFLNLSKKLKEFSILQTIGVQKKEIAGILILNGFVLGVIGVLLGVLLAFIVVAFLNGLLSSGAFVPPDVYKLTFIRISLSISEILMVMAATLILCVIASLVPAFSIYRQSIVKGLRYE